MSWLAQREVGTRAGVRILLWMARVLGRPLAHRLLRPVTLYYALTHREARTASRSYLRRMGLSHDFWAVYTHLLRFAEVALDRFYFLSGNTRGIEIERVGRPEFEKVLAHDGGAILVGAHVGSFEALRSLADDEELPLSVVGFFHNTAVINDELSRIGPNVVNLVDAGRGPVALGLELGELVGQGHLVGILGDREGFGGSEEVAFLGGRARFPTGPFALAMALGCPVAFVCALYEAPGRYAVHCEVILQDTRVPRAERAAALRGCVERYAAALERHVEMAPLNWFNLYEFWDDEDRVRVDARARMVP